MHQLSSVSDRSDMDGGQCSEPTQLNPANPLNILSDQVKVIHFKNEIYYFYFKLMRKIEQCDNT